MLPLQDGVEQDPGQVAAAAAPCGQGIPLCAYCTAQTDCGFASVLQGPLGWAASGASLFNQWGRRAGVAGGWGRATRRGGAGR